MRFVDTNVLLYAVSKAGDERAKAEVARALLKEPDLGLSVQVLQEFYVQATRRGRRDRLSHEQASALVDSWLRFPVHQVDVPLMQSALSTAQRYQVSYWDAAVIEAARALGCGTLLSEDLSAGQDYGGVVVVDPFGTGT